MTGFENESGWRKHVLKQLRKIESKLACSCQYEGLTIQDIRAVGDGTVVLSTNEGPRIMFTTDQNAMLDGPSGDGIEVITEDEFDFNNWDYLEPEKTTIGYYGPMLQFLAKKNETFEINTRFKVIVRLVKYLEETDELEYIGLTIAAYEALLRGEKPCPTEEVDYANIKIGRDGGVDLYLEADGNIPSPEEFPEPGELP